jgi:LysM repeat protein
VAEGSNGYDIEYSGFTSTLPVPVSVTLIDIPPKVGDGMTSSGVGSVLLGGPTTSPASGRVALGTSQPSYLGTIVTYSSATSADGVPLEIGPGKVLAVSSVDWSIPPRETNIAPVDSGPASLATGQVSSTTDSGAPRRYVVAPNDAIAEVAARFDISVAALIYLNAGLQVLGDDQRLFEGTTLNLDPAAV